MKIKESLLFLLDYYELLVKRDANTASNELYRKLELLKTLDEIDNDTVIFVKTLLKLHHECGNDEIFFTLLKDFLKIDNNLILSKFEAYR